MEIIKKMQYNVIAPSLQISSRTISHLPTRVYRKNLDREERRNFN